LPISFIVINKKGPPVWEALLFVFAFFITRRNASHSGEGKKECEEKRGVVHEFILLLILLKYPYCFDAVNKKRARRRVGGTLNLKDYSSSTSSA
jgi:hypothetical protein